MTLFFGFLNQEFTEMWCDASSSSKQNFYGIFQNSYFKGKSALEIPDSKCPLVHVFIYSAFPGDQGWPETNPSFVKNFWALRLTAGWGKASLPHCQKNTQFVSSIQNGLQHLFVNALSLADALNVIASFAEMHSASVNLLSKCWCCPPLSDRNARDWSCQMVHDVLELLRFQLWSGQRLSFQSQRRVHASSLGVAGKLISLACNNTNSVATRRWHWCFSPWTPQRRQFVNTLSRK